MKFKGKNISMVWVDLDDTIIDFRSNSRRALHRLWQEEAAVRRCFDTADEWIDTYERHNHRLWELYGEGRITRTFLRMERFLRPLTEGGMESEEAHSLSERLDTLYLDFLAQERQLIPGSIDLLRFLRESGVKIGCLSNGFKDVQFRKIRNCGLDAWFDLVVLSDDIGVNKPDRRLFDHAMALSGIGDCEAHAIIGDNSMTDIHGGHNAGWGTIQFLRNPTDVASDEADASVSELKDVIALLEEPDHG